MERRPRIYGNEAQFRVRLGRQIARAQDLLDTLAGVRNLMAAAPGGPTGLLASIHEDEWVREVERWRGTIFQWLRRQLAEGAPAVLPVLTAAWPPNTGKPRHARTIEWVEPWLRETLGELVTLRDALGISRRVTAESPVSGQFTELRASNLIEPAVIDGYAKDMRTLKTPRQLVNAIGAAKELTEATLRAALDRLGETWRNGDELNALMKRWRKSVDVIAPPDPASQGTLDLAQAALGNLVTFLAAWRNAYGSGHGRQRYPPGLKPRHARLAVDGAETAIRFIVTTMDDLELLPP